MEPAGIVMPFAGSVAPQGYLLCDGSAVSRATYSALYTAIGDTYGAGDGSTTFNLPDLSGRVVIGVSGSHALGSTGGSETVTLTVDQLPAHTHVIPQHGHGNDITATMPALSHTITQPSFNYNSPNVKNTDSVHYNQVNRYTGTTSTAATRSTNAAVSAHEAADCTVTGSISAAQATNTSSAGEGGSHSNMQAYLAISYVISTGE